MEGGVEEPLSGALRFILAPSSKVEIWKMQRKLFDARFFGVLVVALLLAVVAAAAAAPAATLTVNAKCHGCCWYQRLWHFGS